MIDFVGKNRWFFRASWILVIVGIISLVISQIRLDAPLRLGIDFTGGTSVMLQFSPDTEVTLSQLRAEVVGLGYDEARIQDAGEGNFIMCTREITSDEAEGLAANLGAALDAEVEIVDYYLVSEAVAVRTAGNALIAVIVASVAMLFYIVWAFRRMPKPFHWGICAVVALVHDVFIIVGIFSLLGLLAEVTIDAMFITGILAVVGYSINNTVVIFDRIRENMSKHISPDFAQTVNGSLTEVLTRCLNTSLTTLFVLLALVFFGGATIQYFVLVLVLGVIMSVYSSMCISSQLLVVWEKREWRKLLPFALRST